MQLTYFKTIDLLIGVLLCVGFFLLSADALALDLPIAKTVDTAHGWAFGGTALLIAVMIWAVTLVGALLPSVRAVGWGALLLVTILIPLYFSAPIWVPKLAILS